VIVAGSTWSDDDKELDHYANTNPHIRFIIAPHDISKARIGECLSLYRNSITLSTLKQTSNEQRTATNVLIIDNVGLLSRLYYYATIAYIGGGFGADGVHNVLEAAVYGKPVVFGPEYDKYIEAVELVESGGAYSATTALELEKQFNQLLDDEFLYKQSCLASKEFVAANAGATRHRNISGHQVKVRTIGGHAAAFHFFVQFQAQLIATTIRLYFLHVRYCTIGYHGCAAAKIQLITALGIRKMAYQ
jgi:3-deoxy-D-manno-octulosonic-acid transferase